MSLLSVLSYALVPAAATVAGGVFAAAADVGDRFRSVVQHLAAGVVFAAAASELLPDVMGRQAPAEVAAGFAVGVGLMLGLRALTRRMERRTAGSAAGLAATIGVDVLLDGTLLGIAFAAGRREGLMIVAALTMEMLFLGLSAAVSLPDVSSRRLIGLTVGLALTLGLGATAGTLVSSVVSSGALEVLLSVGLVVLLYLVTEELLVEAHEAEETPLATTAFFAGFLALVLLDMLTA